MPGKEIFSSSKGARVIFGQDRMSQEIFRIEGFLIPEKSQGFHFTSICERSFKIESGIGIHCQESWSFHDFNGPFDAAHIGGENFPSDFHFKITVSLVEVSFEFFLKSGDFFSRVIIASSGIDEHLLVRLSRIETFRKKLPKRFFCEFCDSVPNGHVQCSCCHRPVSMTARFFILHESVPDFERIRQS